MDMEKAKRSSCGTTFPEALGSNTLKMLLMTTSASHLMELTWRRKKSSNSRKRRVIGREGGKLVKPHGNLVGVKFGVKHVQSKSFNSLI